ncbi:MAG: hypothetical protein C4518_05170 [Desulfobacteraceae bacterium]|nr:MAG: hypothetical protein C4518_05170 [Desulfobacteraceae bacterium]
MKKSILFIFMAGFFFLGLTVVAAEEMNPQGMQMEHNAPMGKLIHETDAESYGYHLSYRLIDLQAQMKDMPGMQRNMQGKGTYHLMLTITDSTGKMVDSAQVGYLVVNPDGSEQKVMTMEMKDGYGADINLSKSGEYTIKCKAAAGNKKMIDEFKYKVE